MSVSVPTYAVQYVKSASRATGLPYDLVACYIDEVSAFNSRLVAENGKQGPYQIDVTTFYQVWHGSPFSWADSTIAFTLIMVRLLRQDRGDVRQALADFRYGPGAASADLSWAEGVMECAGYTGLASRSVAPKPLDAAELTDPNVQSDDWSWYVGQSGVWLSQLGDTATYWADYIGRL